MQEIILRQLQGSATDIEIGRLTRWRAESGDNERTYRALSDLWQVGGETRPSSPPRLDAIVQEAENRRTLSRRREVLRRRMSRWGAASLAAAAVVAAVALGVPRLLDRPDPSLGATEFSAGAGETVTMTLTDGSFVRLGPGSRLQFTSDGGNREVWFEGRGFFAVKPDPTRPFVVRTAAGAATALGTRFELSTEDDGLRLIVVEGRMELAGNESTVQVSAGEMALLLDGRIAPIIPVEDVYSLLDWPGGVLLFQSTPLSVVVQELGRQFGRELVVVDDVLGRRRVTAWFDEESFEEILSAICLITDARCAVQSAQVTLSL